MVVEEDRVAELERRTDELAERLERLEHPRRAAPPPGRLLAPRVGEPRGRPEARGTERTARPTTRGTSEARADRRSGASAARAERSAAHEQAETRAGAAEPFDLARLEALIGGRVIAWIGGLAVVLGLALLASIAASNGWIGPAARTGIAAGASFALAALGLFVVRHPIPRRALIATGVAGGFVTACLAGPVYDLVPGVVAAGAGLLVAGAGTALALKLPSRGIAALGLLGGLAAPLLTGTTDTATSVALALVAAAGAAAVVVWKRWDWLRLGIALLAVPQVAAYAAFSNGPLPGALLALAGLAAVLTVAAIGFELRVVSAIPRAASVILLLAGAAAVATAGWWACDQAGHDTLGHLWLAGVALAYAAGGLALRRKRRYLGLLLLSVAVVLADIAAASMADGVVLGLLWSASAAAAAVLARRAGSDREELVAMAGLAGQLMLAVAHALVSAPPTQLLDGATAAGTAELGAAVVVLGVAAHLVAPKARELALPLEAVALALLAYLTVSLASDLALVLAFAAQAVGLDAVAHRSRRGFARDPAARLVGRRPAPGARPAPEASVVVRHAPLAFLAAATVAALATVAPPDALMVGFDHPLPAAAALGTIALTCLRLAHGRRWLLAGAAVALLDLGSGVAAWAAPSDQAGQLAVSALWALTGLGALVAGLTLHRRPLRVAGLGLLLVTAAKVFLVDLATLTSIYRVTSFVAVGLLLLLGAVAWQRAQARTA